MEAVPTGIAIGSDNALYIAQLTGFPFPPGGATIFRASGGSVTPFATGFTNLIDIAAGPNSDLYALEYATNLLAGNLQGTVWHIAPDGTKTKIFSEGLIAPTGIAVARNGTIYVTNSGAVAGQGQLLAIAPVPEPDSLWGLVSIGAVAVGIRGLSRGRK
jgi:glucose/arabinose dehydrogenase